MNIRYYFFVCGVNIRGSPGSLPQTLNDHRTPCLWGDYNAYHYLLFSFGKLSVVKRKLQKPVAVAPSKSETCLFIFPINLFVKYVYFIQTRRKESSFHGMLKQAAPPLEYGDKWDDVRRDIYVVVDARKVEAAKYLK